MTSYTQARQAMRVHTDLEEDLLLLAALSGEEAVSAPFLFELDLLSLDRDIDGERMLRSPIHVELDLPDGGTRSIHGIVRRFVQSGRDEELISYRAEIVPWLWFLSLAHDCRIFQEMDVLEIVEAVFLDQGHSDFEIRCTRTYEKRDYCVQYRESNLNFVSRLLEAEGIFYFFEHEDSKHVLVLADDMTAIKPCEGQPEARIHSQPVPDEDVVLTLDREHNVHAGQVTFADYDYLQPSLSLRSTVAGAEPEEVYDYPGGFTDLDGGERQARLALERKEAGRHVVRGSATCRAFRAGGQFRLLNHFGNGGNQTYAILELRHRARNGAYRAGGAESGTEYRNDLVAIPYSVPYRPPLTARKPVLQGAQTAEVVGAAGEDIYVDEHGRVKVQFPWDRHGESDDRSSCWVRVSQNWAGKKWGGMFIPHIGQEVIVDFLEGDPDRPIITGRVYNAENMPPQSLPANKHKSIIEDDYGNEMVFDATPGKEHVRIYSPSHRSKLELGKSIQVFSDSNWKEQVAGEKGFITHGLFVGGTIGMKVGVDLGGSLSLFAGFKFDLSLSEKIDISIGESLKFSKGQEYKIGGDKFSHHVKGRALLKSDEEVLSIGGGNSKTSIMEGNSNALTLQYGSNSGAFSVDRQIAQKARVGISTGSGLAAMIAAMGLWEGTGDAEWFGLTGPTMGVVIAATIIHALMDEEAEQMTRATVHNAVHSRVVLDDTGVEISSHDGSTENAILRVFSAGMLAGAAVIKAKGNQGILLDAEKGNIVQAAAKEVTIVGKAGVNIEGKSGSDVQISGNFIKIG